jgi:sulfide:quinone oxidoreductase
VRRPLYELVFMLDTWLRRKRIRANVDLTWSTYEQTYIQAFGPRLHDVVTGEFERRVVAGHTGYFAEQVTGEEVRYSNGEVLPYDLLVTISPYVAEVTYPTLPGDDRGFIQTDLATRQVVDHPDVYAVGDARSRNTEKPSNDTPHSRKRKLM